MGGHPQQVNSGQASQANAGAQAASQAEANLANQNASEQKLMFDNLFGGDGKSGSMGKFLDPNSLNVSGPTGAFETQYKNAENQTAQGYSNARGALARTWAGTGSSMMPNGYQASQTAALDRGQADSRGAMFTDYAGRSYQDAVNNFWNANNIASGQAASSGQTAQAANASGGNIEAGIYGTAGKQAQGSGILNSALGAAGTVGAGAFMCPARGSKIRTEQGDIPAEKIRAGMKLLQKSGGYRELERDPQVAHGPIISIYSASSRSTRVGAKHAFVRASGGYANADEAQNVVVMTHGGRDTILTAGNSGEGELFVIEIGGDHTYLCDGFWSLD